MSEITDLTGYTWVANGTIRNLNFCEQLSIYDTANTWARVPLKVRAYNGTYNTDANVATRIRFLSSSNSAKKLSIPETYDTPYDRFYIGYEINETSSSTWRFITDTSYTGVVTSKPTVEILKDNIVLQADRDLIVSWLETNGTLTPPPPPNLTFDLTQLPLPSGRHEIQFTLSDDGLTKRDSLHSNTVYYDVPYNVTADVTHAMVTGSPTIMPFSQSTRIIVADDYYVNPDSVEVTNATLVSYVKSTGVVTFENPIHDVHITGACTAQQFIIAKNAIVNGTLTGDDYITHFETKTVTIVPNEDYILPETIEVTNADYTYDSATGEVTLFNAIGYVTVEAECPPEIEQLMPCLTELDEDDKTVLITPVDETTRGNEAYVERIAVKDTFGGVTTTVEIIPRDGYDVEQDGTTVYIKTAPASQNGSEVTIT